MEMKMPELELEESSLSFSCCHRKARERERFGTKRGKTNYDTNYSEAQRDGSSGASEQKSLLTPSET